MIREPMGILTVSVTMYTPNEKKTIEDIFAAAERMLFKADVSSVAPSPFAPRAFTSII